MTVGRGLQYQRNVLIRIQVLVHLHGKVDHVGFAEQIQLGPQQLILFVNLQKKNIF